MNFQSHTIARGFQPTSLSLSFSLLTHTCTHTVGTAHGERLLADRAKHCMVPKLGDGSHSFLLGHTALPMPRALAHAFILVCKHFRAGECAGTDDLSGMRAAPRESHLACVPSRVTFGTLGMPQGLPRATDFFF